MYNDYRRYLATRKKYNFNHLRRCVIRSSSANNPEYFDTLPIKESIRWPIQVNKNGFGDYTRYDGYGYRQIKWCCLYRLIEGSVGLNYDSVYSKLCKKFRGRDRNTLDRNLEYLFRFDKCAYRGYCKPYFRIDSKGCIQYV